MLSHTCSILLAINLFVCPVFCQAGDDRCVGQEAAAEPHCCDACREQTITPASNSSFPSDPDSPEQDTCCQCICGGAVVENSALEFLDLGVTSWTALPDAEVSRVVVSELHHAVRSWTPLPDDDMNPGRAKRCLMMSFLC
jgi:hypothetical protein